MLNRREFVVATASAAGGLLLAIRFPASAKPKPYEPYPAAASEVSAWLAIEPDNSVVIRCAQAEMGEGVFTSLPMLIAEELEVDWKKVRVEYASSNRSLRENNVYGRMTTVGSYAIRGTRVAMQTAGANARERLRAAAAKAWGVPHEQTRAELGRVHETGGSRANRRRASMCLRRSMARRCSASMCACPACCTQQLRIARSLAAR
jgi:isoquinoline 1-oxidoreductase beta subunit